MSETVSRIISGFTLVGLVILALIFDNFYWLFPFLLIFSVSLLGVLEFYKVTDRGLEGRALSGLGAFFTVLIILAFYANFLAIMAGKGTELNETMAFFVKVFYPGFNLTIPLLIVFFISTLSVQLFWRPIDGTIYSVSITLFGVVYACIPFCTVFFLFTFKYGVFLLVYLAAQAILTDTGAYFGGRWFGKHNAGLAVSPKKTWEGYAGGLIFANIMLVSYVIGWNHFAAEGYNNVPVGILETVIFTLIMSFISVLGDLSESLFKRDAKIKDSASIIPGHGGVLDLVDALIFVFPVGYYYFFFKSLLFPDLIM